MLLVRDERHRVYRLTELLGRGGQGSVWRTEHPDLLVKLRDGEITAVRSDIRRVQHLPLDGLPVARPEAVVSVHRYKRPVGSEPRAETVSPDDASSESPAPSVPEEASREGVGFVMELEHSRRPLEHWLDVKDDDVAGWWRGLGGAESRLRLLAAAAAVIAELHRRGVVVGDISPRNFLVSRTSDSVPVVLIDPDDLHYAGDPPSGDLRFSAPHVSPEVYRGEAPHDRRSDAYAIALLVAHAMLLEHPLMGRPVVTGSPDREIEALRGGLPWVYDMADDTNPPANRRDLTTLVGGEVAELFHRYFEAGRDDPAARPTSAALANALHRAADACRRCVSCGDGGPGAECVSCGRPLLPGLALGGVADPTIRFALWDDSQRIVNRRFAIGTLGRGNEPVVLVGAGVEGARVELIGDVPVTLVVGEHRERLQPGRPKQMKLGDELQLGADLIRVALQAQDQSN